MNKKIKIIELYNLIANAEKIPKKIKYDGEVYHHNVLKTNYFRDDNGSTLSYVDLNDEVEILEDNTEEGYELLKSIDIKTHTDSFVEVEEELVKLKTQFNRMLKVIDELRKEKE